MKPLSILIADDDPVLLMILRQNLQPAGFEVHQAASGSQAVDMAANRDYDAIVLDMRMPGLDGLQTIHAIRHGHPEHDLPIILMSARPEASIRERAIEAGADAFMEKPFRSRELAARIQSLRDEHTTPTLETRTTTTGAAGTALPSPIAGATGAAPPAPVVVLRGGAPPTPAAPAPAITAFKPRVVDAHVPAPPAPTRTTALQTALWIDLDHSGQVRQASTAAADALHMPSFPTRLKLDAFLDRTHELVPSVAWSDLSVAMQNGFLRVISPRDTVAPTHRAYEVQVERTDTGCRLWLADVTDSLLAHAAPHSPAGARTQP